MSLIGIVREQQAESRVAATPETVKVIRSLGYEVVVEKGAGEKASFPDSAYEAAGAKIADTTAAWGADLVLSVNAPADAEISKLKKGAIFVGVLSPALKPELLESLAKQGVTALAMDAVPRISRAQSMDVLSSMANIAGYRAVIEAAHEFGRFFTGQVTAAGKVAPAKVLVAGAGVAGLAGISCITCGAGIASCAGIAGITCITGCACIAGCACVACVAGFS
jgi:NAD(P) transhydrogenase subunit alpha